MRKSQWQSKPKITPPQEKPLERTSPTNNENTAAEIEETRRLLIGALLTQISCTEQFAVLLQLAVRSNSVTPKTAEALLFDLSEMVNLSMNMSDQLKALTITLMRSRTITQSDREISNLIDSVDMVLGRIADDMMMY